MKKTMIIAVIAAGILFAASSVMAKCYCMCVENEKQWVCENSWDVTPGHYCGGPCY